MRVVANWRQKTIKFSSYSQTRNLATSTNQTPHKTFFNSDSHVKHLCNHKKFSEAILILCQNKRLSEAIRLLYRIDRPSHTIYSTLLQHCLQQKALDLGKKVHQHVKNNVRFKAGVIIYNRLLQLYCKCGCIDDARKLFDQMTQKDVCSWNTMVSGYVKARDLRGARGVFDEMPERDYYSWNTMISGYVKAGDLRGARGLFDEMTERDVCSWNIMVSGYVKAGDLRGARGVFDEMPERDYYSWNTMISGYVEAGDLRGARGLFDEMTERDVCSWTTMLSGYVKAGDLKGARGVFDEMPERDFYSWNTMILGYVKAGDLRGARGLFDEMTKRDVCSWTTMLSGYVKAGDLKGARGVFDEMPERNSFSWTTMFSGYVKAGDLKGARGVFDEMPERSSYSWNTMILGYVKAGDLRRASGLFDEMTDRDVCSWNTMLSGYVKAGDLKGARGVFDEMPERNSFSWNTMILGYVEAGDLRGARGVFDAMPERDVCSWNTMLSGYVNAGDLKRAGRVFDAMPLRDVYSWNTMISGYVKAGYLRGARGLFDEMTERDVCSWTAMLYGYVKAGDLKGARGVFDEMPERNCYSWNTMILGYVKAGDLRGLENLLVELFSSGIRLDKCTLFVVLTACKNQRAEYLGKQIHGRVIRFGCGQNSFANSELIHMYSKLGNVEIAYRIFKGIPQPDLVSWNSLIRGYAQNGQPHEALRLFELLLESGNKPNHITLSGVLSACTHAGLVDEGLEYFHSIKEKHGVEYTEHNYSGVIDLLGRSGRFKEAEDFILSMPMKPCKCDWASLLNSCKIHGNIELAKRSAEALFQIEPDHPATYATLSNIYATAGKWDEVVKLRKVMNDKGVVNRPGISWIEIKGKVHTFMVGDTSHPYTSEIYDYLLELLRRMKEEGYNPGTNYVLHDVEEEEKEQSISYHSEKLAVAFGIIATPRGTTIKVFKNLRTCVDCHTSFKYISKIVERKIIARDPTRFHCFEGGICSCKDYW